MKISELADDLILFKEEHGDLDITISTFGGDAEPRVVWVCNKTLFIETKDFNAD